MAAGVPARGGPSGDPSARARRDRVRRGARRRRRRDVRDARSAGGQTATSSSDGGSLRAARGTGVGSRRRRALESTSSPSAPRRIARRTHRVAWSSTGRLAADSPASEAILERLGFDAAACAHRSRATGPGGTGRCAAVTQIERASRATASVVAAACRRGRCRSSCELDGVDAPRSARAQDVDGAGRRPARRRAAPGSSGRDREHDVDDLALKGPVVERALAGHDGVGPVELAREAQSASAANEAPDTTVAPIATRPPASPPAAPAPGHDCRRRRRSVRGSEPASVVEPGRADSRTWSARRALLGSKARRGVHERSADVARGDEWHRDRHAQRRRAPSTTAASAVGASRCRRSRRRPLARPRRSRPRQARRRRRWRHASGSSPRGRCEQCAADRLGRLDDRRAVRRAATSSPRRRHRVGLGPPYVRTLAAHDLHEPLAAVAHGAAHRTDRAGVVPRRRSRRPPASPSRCPGTCPAPRRAWCTQSHVEEVHDEQQRLARGDRAGSPTLAVAEVRRDDEPSPATDAHAGDAVVPSRDDLSLADGEGERLVSVPRGVELLAGRVSDADVVDGGAAAFCWLRPRRR